MIVADTNLVLYLPLDTDKTASAERGIQTGFGLGRPTAVASECRNALVQYVRYGQRFCQAMWPRTVEVGRRLLTQLPVDHLSDDIVRLAAERGLSACDAESVVLSEGYTVPLVTSDARVLRAGGLAISPEIYRPIEFA